MRMACASLNSERKESKIQQIIMMLIQIIIK